MLAGQVTMVSLVDGSRCARGLCLQAQRLIWHYDSPMGLPARQPWYPRWCPCGQSQAGCKYSSALYMFCITLPQDLPAILKCSTILDPGQGHAELLDI